MLERIKAEKERLIKEGKIKRSKKLESSGTSHYENVPFEVPGSWVWCKLEDILSLISGQDLPPHKYNDQSIGIPYIIGASNIDKEKLQINRWTDTPSVLSYKKDLLVVCKGAGVGKMVINDIGDVHIARQIQAVRDCFNMVNVEYIKTVVACNVSVITSKANGLIPGLKRELLLSLMIPLPPFTEQQRIVSEIKRWFALIDIIEEGKDDLLTIIKHAKSMILDFAIHGKLVPQDSNDEPAFELLKRINPNAEITCDNTHNRQLPQGWCVCQLKDICSKIVDGDHNPPVGEPNKTKYMMLSAQNIVNGKIIEIDKARYLSKDKFELCDKRTQIRKEDLLVTIVGTLGRTCIFDSCEYITFQRSVACLTTFIFNGYLKHFIDSPCTQNYITENARGTAQKGFYLNQLEKITVIIPPLMEQLRIVTEIDKLFSALDNIQNSLEV